MIWFFSFPVGLTEKPSFFISLHFCGFLDAERSNREFFATSFFVVLPRVLL
jgi:hypothetical protein